MENYYDYFLLLLGLFFSPYIQQLSKLPIAIIEIIIGSLLFKFGFYPDNDILDIISQFGFYYLMFLVGMELDIKELNTIDLKKNILYMVLLISSSFFFLSIFNFNIYYLFLFPLMSIGMLKIFSSDNSNEEWFKKAIITGLFGEILSIILLTILETYNEVKSFNIELLEKVSLFLLIVLIIIFLFIIIHKISLKNGNIILKIMPNGDKNSESFRVGFFLMFFFIGLMDYFHFEKAFGAFIAGFIIINLFNHKASILEHRFNSLGFGFFIPIFFINIGTNLDIGLFFNLKFLSEIIQVVFITFSVHFISVLVFYKELSKLDLVLFATSHSMPLTLLIVLSTIGANLGLLDQYDNNIVISASIFEVFIGFILIKTLKKYKNNLINN